MASSHRIDFTGEAGRISRTQPAATTGHMTAAEWTSFCDGVDAELEPLESASNVMKIMLDIMLLLFLGAFLYSLFLIFTSSDRSESHIFWFWRPVCAMMLSMFLVGCMIYSRALAAHNKSVHAVCVGASERHPSLSFHLRYEYWAHDSHRDRQTNSANDYIEVSIANALPASCRIDFTGEAGRISRTQPAATTGHMTAAEWTSFCDGVDAELKPLESARRMLTIVGCLFRGTFLYSLFAIIFASSDRSGPYVFLGLCALFGFCVSGCVYDARARALGTAKKVNAVCTETSEQHPSLSFQARYECYHTQGDHRHRRTESPETTCHIDAESKYIEVSVANPPLTSSPAVVAASCCGEAYPAAPVIDALAKPLQLPTAVATTAPATIAVGRSAVERLAELEEIKPMLRDNEYEQKRRDIIDNV